MIEKIKSILPYLLYIDKKLLKYFGLLIICCFGLLSFTSAGYTRQVSVYGYNPFIQNFDVQLNRSGIPLTQNLGYTKSMFVFMQGNTECNFRSSTVRIYWWWYNGVPYYYIYYYTPGYLNPVTKQGNITSYQVCDEIVDYTSSSQPGNCLSNNVGESTRDIFGNFLNSLTNQDNYYFDYSCSTYSYGDNMYWDLNAPFCISNHSIGHSLCFNPGISWGGNGNLSGSAGVPFGYDYDSISTSYLQYPPSPSGNGGNLTDNGSQDNGKVVYFPCTNGDALDYYKSKGYTKNLCFGGDSFWDLGTEEYSTQFLTPGIGYNYYQIYEHLNGATGTGNNYTTGNNIDVWFNYWRSQYTWWTTQGVSTVNPFSGYPQVLFGLFNFVNRYGISYSSESILDYCNLELYQNPDGLDYLYNGFNKNLVCNNNGVVVNITGAIDGSGNIDYDGLGLGVGSSRGNTFSGDVYSGSDYTGDLDPASYIKSLVDKVKSEITIDGINGNVFGFLPVYIVVALFGLIIFRFFSH